MFLMEDHENIFIAEGERNIEEMGLQEGRMILGKGRIYYWATLHLDISWSEVSNMQKGVSRI